MFYNISTIYYSHRFSVSGGIILQLINSQYKVLTISKKIVMGVPQLLKMHDGVIWSKT
jgi:hypothetical protein